MWSNLLGVIRCAVTDVVKLHWSFMRSNIFDIIQRLSSLYVCFQCFYRDSKSRDSKRALSNVSRAGGRASQRELCALTHTFTHPPSKKVRPQWARSLKEGEATVGHQAAFRRLNVCSHCSSMSVPSVSIETARESCLMYRERAGEPASESCMRAPTHSPTHPPRR